MEGFLRALARLAKVAVVVAGVVAGLVWLSKRRAAQAPAVAPPVWPPLPVDEAEPVVAEVGGAPATVEEAIAAVEGLEVVVAPASDASPPEATDVSAPEAAGTEDPDRVLWVVPKDGGCPEGYPVKAKVASRIYHSPGGLSYARTVPDRCYASAADAEADGFRAARR